MSVPQPQPTPVALSVALGGTLSTGVALLAVFIPGLDVITQALIIAFGNSVILTGSIIWAQARTTPTATPILDAGTVVTVTTPAGEPNREVTV